MPSRNKKAPSVKLPKALETLLSDYQGYCLRNGLRESSVALNLKIDRWFLESLSLVGCESTAQINARTVTAACLALKSNFYLSTVVTFLRFLFSEGYTDKDYSGVVPSFKRPQPMPTVYTEEEIKKVEAALHAKINKRDYAAVLFATRLGFRSGDICRLTFSDVDFEKGVVRVTQQKTNIIVEFELLPEIKTMLQNYINNERPQVALPYIFVTQESPYKRLSLSLMGKIVSQGLKKAGVETGERKRGPHAFRSSMASSMVNDNIPYDVVRKALGHIDPNAIKSYARLDIEQLRLYALPVPETTGGFAKLLEGRKVL